MDHKYWTLSRYAEERLHLLLPEGAADADDGKDWISQCRMPVFLQNQEPAMDVTESLCAAPNRSQDRNTTTAMPIRRVEIALRPDASTRQVESVLHDVCTKIYTSAWLLLEEYQQRATLSETAFSFQKGILTGIGVVEDGDPPILLEAALGLRSDMDMGIPKPCLCLSFFHVDDWMNAFPLDDDGRQRHHHYHWQWKRFEQQQRIGQQSNDTHLSSDGVATPTHPPRQSFGNDEHPNNGIVYLVEGCAFLQYLERHKDACLDTVIPGQGNSLSAAADYLLQAYRGSESVCNQRTTHDTKGLNRQAFAPSKGSKVRTIYPALSTRDYKFIICGQTQAVLLHLWKGLDNGSHPATWSSMKAAYKYGLLAPEFASVDPLFLDLLRVHQAQEAIDQVLHEWISADQQMLDERRQELYRFRDLLEPAIRDQNILLPLDQMMQNKQKRTSTIKSTNVPQATNEHDLSNKFLRDPDVQCQIVELLKETKEKIVQDVSRCADDPADSIRLAIASMQRILDCFVQAYRQTQHGILSELQADNQKSVLDLDSQMHHMVFSTLAKSKTHKSLLAASYWFCHSQSACNTDGRPLDDFVKPQVPLLVFDTFSGQGCVTSNYIILVDRNKSKLSTLFRKSGGDEQVLLYDLFQIDLSVQRRSLIDGLALSATAQKVCILWRSKVQCSFSPSIGAEPLADFVRVLKSLHA